MIEAVARDAAEMRSELTRYLRAYAPARWSQMIRTGVEFTIPEAWSILSPSKMAANLVRAERDRIEGTPFYALDPEVSAAAIQAGVAGIILTPDALPAPSGSIYFHHPVAEPGPHRAGPARIVTWGAPPPSMGLPGLWLTWYADLRESKDPAVAAMQPDARIVLDQENFLRFLPAIDDRLIPGEPPATETARILRTVLLALFAIKDGLLPTREINAPPAGNEGCIVHVASAPGEDPSELPRAMVRAATRHSEEALRLVLGEE
ncbi:hypothetical protein [Actinospica robiniae]|jgi:hypothetical protein|uniref:hypothetical protein n=1 Tax=Actinospica robiniae TaxID=304901 RepID=UPI0003F518FF|nr:hypothetical protein [Actinospica robiniae]